MGYFPALKITKGERSTKTNLRLFALWVILRFISYLKAILETIFDFATIFSRNSLQNSPGRCVHIK